MSAGERVLLKLENISVGYGQYPVISHFDLEIKPGELVCVLGPSGCGKTTLLKVAGSFLPPQEGRVFFNNKEVHTPEITRIMVFQDQDQLFPWKNVLQNIKFGLNQRNTGYPKNQVTKQAQDALAEVGLGEWAKHYPHQLSGGMRQRVALARAFVSKPQLLLMDEPFGSVDSPTRKELQLLLLSLLEHHHSTALFVTHDVEEALFLGTRILVLNSSGRPMVESTKSPQGNKSKDSHPNQNQTLHEQTIRNALGHPEFRQDSRNKS